MATIQIVAKKAGVSVATVSRVINNPQIVALKTRTKVENIIQELNYEPNMLGRNLRTSESRLILTLIPTISNPFYSRIINGIEDVALENGYNILLCETDSNPTRESIYFNLLRNKLADGIISMDPTINRQKLLDLANTFPVVQCSEYDEKEELSYVTINHELAAYHAVRYLIKTGHREIALINSDTLFLYARARQKGYERALIEHDIPLNNNLIIHTDQIEFEEGQQAMKKLLTLEQRPTAVFAVSDVLAIGALKEIHTNKLRVPDDIALVGFDKIDFSNMTHPTLTTISQPGYVMGSTSATMLIDKIKGTEVDSVILEHELIIRDST